MWYVYAFAIWYRLAPLPGQGSAIPMVCNNEVPLWLANVLDSQCKERYWTLQVAVQLLPWLGHAHWTPQDNDSLSANLARLHPAERQKNTPHTPQKVAIPAWDNKFGPAWLHCICCRSCSSAFLNQSDHDARNQSAFDCGQTGIKEPLAFGISKLQVLP